MSGLIWNKLLNIRKSELFSDFSIKIHSNEYKAHRIILGIRSNFFAELFKKDPNIKTFTFPDRFDFTVVKSVLDYLYSSKINLAKHQVFEYLEIFHFLQAVDILDLDFEFYKKYITDDTILFFKKIISSRGNKYPVVSHDLEDIIDSYIMSNFDKLQNNKYLSDLDIKDMEYYLGNDQFPLSEYSIIDIIERWTKDPNPELYEKKLKLSEYLYLKIRFGFLNPNQLKNILTNPFIENFNKVTEKIQKAIQYVENPKTHIWLKDDLIKLRNTETLLYYGGGIDYNSNGLINDLLIFRENSFIQSKLNLPIPTAFCKIIAYNNYPIIFGGLILQDKLLVNSTQVKFYNFLTNSWISLADIPRIRIDFELVLYSDKIYLIGGVDKQNNFITQVDCYDILTDSWSVPFELEFGLYKFGICNKDHKVYLIGGIKENDNISDRIYELDILKNSGELKSVCSLNRPLHEMNVVQIEPDLYYIVRGWTNGIDGKHYHESLYFFDLYSLTCLENKNLLTSKTNMSCAAYVEDKWVLLFDGWNFNTDKKNKKIYMIEIGKTVLRTKFKFKNPLNVSGSVCFYLNVPRNIENRK